MLSRLLSAIALAVFGVTLCAATPLRAGGADSEPRGVPSPRDLRAAAGFVAEMRRTFTIQGKAVPPQIFRDFGDGDLADSGGIWVAVDVAAAIGSNLYFDEVRKEGEWVSQKTHRSTTGVAEETAYSFIGSTKNGLLVALATYSGGGSGIFYTLHILDVAAASAFDMEGRPYRRIALTNLRSVTLGDRWEGRVTIKDNTVRIVTDRSGPGETAGPRPPLDIEARRP